MDEGPVSPHPSSTDISASSVSCSVHSDVIPSQVLAAPSQAQSDLNSHSPIEHDSRPPTSDSKCSEEHPACQDATKIFSGGLSSQLREGAPKSEDSGKSASDLYLNDTPEHIESDNLGTMATSPNRIVSNENPESNTVFDMPSSSRPSDEESACSIEKSKNSGENSEDSKGSEDSKRRLELHEEFTSKQKHLNNETQMLSGGTSGHQLDSGDSKGETIKTDEIASNIKDIPPNSGLPGNKDPIEVKNSSLPGPFPIGFRLSPALELPLEPSEVICCFACHEANLYIGTSKGKLLHLYLFEDATEYMLIMQLSVNDACRPIEKIVLLPDAEVSLVLCNQAVLAFSFPELSPCHINKIHHVQDFSVLRQGQKSKREHVNLDKIIVFTTTRIRLVQISKTAFKLLKDINYSGALTGESTASNEQANYNKFCVVANSTSYEVVDMQKPHKITLFEYISGTSSAVRPYILAFEIPGASTEESTEEYLLSIHTDEHNSMAMIINSSGDATRGTLMWPDLGYPTNGLVVEWPYVFGLFKSGSCIKLVVSSLETLEVIRTCNLEDIINFSERSDTKIWSSSEGVRVYEDYLSSISAQVNYSNGELCAGQQNYYHTSHTILSSGKALYCFVKPTLLADKIQSFMDDFYRAVPTNTSPESFSAYTEYFSKHENIVSQTLHLALLVITEDFERLKLLVNPETDIRLLLLFCAKNMDDPKDLFWASYKLPKVVRELLMSIRSTNRFVSDRSFEFFSQKCRKFVLWLIPTVLDSETFDEPTRQRFREYYYTILCKNSSEIITRLHLEEDVWSGQNEINDGLMQYFEREHFFIVLIEVYLIKQSAGNRSLPWEEKIVDACLKLLSGKWKNTTLDDTSLEAAKLTIKDGKSTKTFDLSSIVYSQLNKISDEESYTERLLDFVSIDAEDGLHFLQKNSESRFRSTHKKIFQQVSKSSEFDTNFPLLKLQFIEQSFLEMLQASDSFNSIDLRVAEELMGEYVRFLNQDDSSPDYQKLNSLFREFQAENDLSDPTWPKITWLEFLSLHLYKSECSEFLETWVKLNEVLFILSCRGSPRSSPDFRFQGPAVEYSQVAFTCDQDKVTYFIDICDYTAAEHSALYAVPPISRDPILLKHLASEIRIDLPRLSDEEITNSLESILSFYLNISDKTCRDFAVMHMVEAFGTRVFGIDRILNLLPEDFPLMYVQEFLVTALINLEEQKGQVTLKKAMAKLDSKRSGKIAGEFEEYVNSL